MPLSAEEIADIIDKANEEAKDFVLTDEMFQSMFDSAIHCRGRLGGVESIGQRSPKNALLADPAEQLAREYYEALISRLGQPLEVRLDAGGGRGKGLFATSDLEAGDIVLVERPLVGVQHLESKADVSTCSHCFRPVGTVEEHVGAKICCMINELSEATEEGDLAGVQDRVDKIQAAVNAKLLEGLLSGSVKLPLTQHVHMPRPVKCRGDCGEEYCSTACEQQAWEQHHCLLCSDGAQPSGSHDGKVGASSSSSSSSSSSKDGGGSSSKQPLPRIVHGVSVNRRKLADFYQHADETNDIFRVAAQVIAMTLITADKLLQQAAADAAEDADAQAAFAAALSAASAAARTAAVMARPGDAEADDGADDAVATSAYARAACAAAAGDSSSQQRVLLPAEAAPPPSDAQQQQQYLQVLQAAFLPFALGHKAPWWECVAAEEEGDEEDEAEMRGQLMSLAEESLALLRAALADERFPQLFELQLYGCLVGLCELNNLALTVPAPVARYKAMLAAGDSGSDAALAPADVAAARAEVAALLDALGSGADDPAEGTAFYALQSCINHSCQPNAAAECLASGQMVVTALAPIPAGGEVLLSYIDEEGAAYEERQAMLADYGFVCRCERCNAEELAAELASALAEQQQPVAA